MKSFAAEFEKAHKDGKATMYVWAPFMEDPATKFRADVHLAHWLRCLDVKGYYTTAKFWRHHARVETRDDKGLTLPGAPPWVYFDDYEDHGINPWRDHPNEMWAETRVGKFLDLEGRKAQVAELRSLMSGVAANMQMFADEPKGKYDTAPPAKPKTLAELKQEAIDNPVKISAGLAKRMGLKQESNDV
jgi:hypothetical protein